MEGEAAGTILCAGKEYHPLQHGQFTLLPLNNTHYS